MARPAASPGGPPRGSARSGSARRAHRPPGPPEGPRPAAPSPLTAPAIPSPSAEISRGATAGPRSPGMARRRSAPTTTDSRPWNRPSTIRRPSATRACTAPVPLRLAAVSKSTGSRARVVETPSSVATPGVGAAPGAAGGAASDPSSPQATRAAATRRARVAQRTGRQETRRAPRGSGLRVVSSMPGRYHRPTPPPAGRGYAHRSTGAVSGPPTSPVFTVPEGSTRRIRHSSRATGLCLTPRGTT